MTAVAWVIALVLAGLAALVLEVFVPSGGVLGFLSVMALLAGVTLAFVEQGAWFGMATLAVTGMAVPVALGLAFRLFPETPLGRRVMPAPPRPDEVVPDADRRTLLRGLVGRRGRTTTELLPWGGVDVDGVPYEAVSESGPIAKDVVIEVAGVQGGAVVVRAALAPPTETPRPRPAPDTTVPRDLEQSLETFDFDALDRDRGSETMSSAEHLDSDPPRKQS